MYLAHGVRAVAVALGVVTMAAAATAAASGAVTTGALAMAGTAPQAAAAPTVAITPGTRHQQREPRTRPSTTAECEQAIGIACYDPAQIQRAYNLRTLYSRGITGKGATIVVIDPYGSPTIGRDLRTFDRAE